MSAENPTVLCSQRCLKPAKEVTPPLPGIYPGLTGGFFSYLERTPPPFIKKQLKTVNTNMINVLWDLP